MNTAVRGRLWLLVQQARWQDLPGRTRLYRIGLALLLSVLLLGALSASHLLIAATLFTGSGLCGLAFLSEVYDWLALRSERLGFKVVLGVLSVMAGAVATGAAATYVALATGQEPGSFKTTIAFLAPLAFLPVLALVAALFAMFSMPFVLLFSVGRAQSGGRKSDGEALRLMGRLVGLVALISVLLTIPTTSSGIDRKLKELAAYSAYFLDMQPHPSCGPGSGDRVARVNDQFVVVGRLTDDGVAFARRACSLDAATADLPPSRASSSR